jgi:thioredoxin-like negative regulator of GroEL
VVAVGAGVLFSLVPTREENLANGGTATGAAAAGTVAIPEVVDAADLDRLIAGHHGPVLLDFHADWCEPCKALHPRLERLAATRPDLLVLGIDAVKADALGKRYEVENLPLLVLLSGGTECARHVGDPELAALRAWVAFALAAKAAKAADAASATAAVSATSATSATAASP